MNPTLKQFLINVAKNAVNAGLLSLGPVYHNPADYSFDTTHGLWGIVRFLVLPAIAIREGLVYIPKILKWSQTTNGNGNGS